MMVGRRFAAWTIGHDKGGQALPLGIRDHVLEHGFYLLTLLREGRRSRQCDRH
jgi:hypothetical protein